MADFKVWLATWARRFAEWLSPTPTPKVVEVSDRVLELISRFKDTPVSGESKRHQVLARLLKDGMSESDAALAIELAIQASKGNYYIKQV